MAIRRNSVHLSPISPGKDWLVAMRSLAFSLAFSTPRKQNTKASPSCLLLKNFDKNVSQLAIRTQQTHQNDGRPLKTTLLVNETPNLVVRREVLAIASGVSMDILARILLQPQFAEALEGASCEFSVSPSGLAFCDRIVGTGPQATQGQLIKAHYVGKLENGKVFDSSYNRGKPLTFRVGVGEVIKGWDQGILGSDGVPPMLAGGKRTLKIPPELGYGMRGAGCKGGTCIIPPNSVLLFDVEFIGKV